MANTPKTTTPTFSDSQKKTILTQVAGSAVDVFNFVGDETTRRHARESTLQKLDFIQAASHFAGSFSGIEANKPLEQIRDIRAMIIKQGKADKKDSGAGLAGQLLTAALVVGAALI